jgi:hypothetical protein
MFCPDCGSEVAEGRKFCGKCGGRLNAGVAGGTETTQGAPAHPDETAAPAPARPASLRNKLVYALIALLAILGGVAWWWFHRPAPPYKVKDPGIYPFQGLSTDGRTTKTGFIDANGKVLVEPEWDAADVSTVLGQSVYCNEGLCGVLKDGKWGYIDTTGKLVIPNQFDSLGPFIEGLARVNIGNQVGYIDKTGQYAINPQFTGAGDFHAGLAAVRADGGWGFINRAGTFVIKPRFQAASTDGFSEGIVGVCAGEQTLFGTAPGKCGYIDRNGTFAIKPQFDSVGTFSEGLAAVQTNGKWGYINASGQIVINPQFNAVTMFTGGLAVVTVAGHSGTINKQGKYVLNPGQYNLQPREGDFQPFSRRNLSNPSIPGGYLETGLISRNGTWEVMPTKAITGIPVILGSVFYANLEGTPTVISISGKVLTGWYKGASVDSLAQDIENQQNAYRSMGVLNGAEASYTNTYPANGFTASLDKLGPANGAPDMNHAGLIDATLATGTKDNYQFVVTTPSGGATGGPNSSYFIVAKPLAGHGGPTFCTDGSGTIHFTVQPEECTLTSPIMGD